MEKIWSDDAWDDYIYWQGQDKKTFGFLFLAFSATFST